ncbi:MAG: hypothetical protein JSU63_08480, partial [Phycisphaerales bacterium]
VGRVMTPYEVRSKKDHDRGTPGQPHTWTFDQPGGADSVAYSWSPAAGEAAWVRFPGVVGELPWGLTIRDARGR